MADSHEESGRRPRKTPEPDEVLTGWHFWLVILALCLALLLSTLETTIIATALIDISSSLGDFGKSNWIVIAYLLTYTGFLIIFTRLSDIFGRKLALLSAMTLFTVFSLACGVAQTMEQLIVFRAFQGIGGSGIYGMVMAISPEITPAAKFGLVSGCISAVFASSSILGPIIGGAITSTTTWRWVFYLNIPAGSIVGFLLFWEFPRHRKSTDGGPRRLAQIDWPGVILSLAGSIVLVFPLEQGGVEYPWSSPIIISTFVVGGVSWLVFAIWETYLTMQGQKISMLPVFPVGLATHRVVGSALLSGFLTGFPFMVIIIFLPQRFQIENGLSPVDAGVKMLALLLMSAFGAGLAGFICSKKNISFYLLVLSNVLQIIGLGLLSSVPNSETVLARQYGYQVILGLGFGLGLSSLVIVTRVEVSAADLAVTMGAITQVRVLGGVVGIAIAQVILSSSVRSDLPAILTPTQITLVQADASSISTLEPAQIFAVRKVYGDAFNQQTRMVMYFACASLFVSLFAWRRELRSFADAGRVGDDKRLSVMSSGSSSGGGGGDKRAVNRLSVLSASSGVGQKAVNRLSVMSGEGIMIGGGVAGARPIDGRGVRASDRARVPSGVRWSRVGKHTSSPNDDFADDISLVNSPSQTSFYSQKSNTSSMPQRPEDSHSVFGEGRGGMPHLVVDINQSDLRVDFMRRYP